MHDQEDEWRVCFACIGEAYLSQVIEKKSVTDECSYCGEREQCLSLEKLATQGHPFSSDIFGAEVSSASHLRTGVI